MTTREYLLDIAASKLGGYAKGSPEVEAIWASVLRNKTPAQIKQYAKVADWCGGLVLCCLKEAGLAPEEYWQIGSGFVLRVLGYKSATKTPKPGDIGVRAGTAPRLLWHHFFVTEWNGQNDWHSIDGNSPTCARKHHTSLDPTTTFYSIERLLPALPGAGFTSDSPFAVPGVQEK